MTRIRSIAVAGLIGALCACATPGGPGGYTVALATETVPLPADLRARVERSRKITAPQVEIGLRALATGNLELASRSFNLALKVEPENPQLHFLNALAYHLNFAKGTYGDRDLAESGYLVALRLEPGHALASYYLGLLQLQVQRYSEAQHHLVRAVTFLDQDNLAPLQALAIASYYARDLTLALWAVNKALQRQPADALTLRSAALVQAAVGRNEDARQSLQRYARLESQESLVKQLQQRVSQWNAFHVDSRNSAGAGSSLDRSGTTSAPVQLAQQGPASNAAPRLPTLINAPQSAPSGGPVAPNWSDCGQPQESSGYVNSYDSNSSGIPGPVQALPSPCVGRPLPRMVLLDAAILRTEDTASTSKGINLLQGLSIALGATASRTRTTGTSAAPWTTVFSQTATVGSNCTSGTGCFISYSLNIANAVDRRNEVLARPSLVALDRHPSTFFSGTQLKVALATQFANVSAELPTGVGLSVTPTFIDDDTLLMAVHVQRSFLETGQLDLSKTVQSSKTNATVNVRMKVGETLIISGLNERETSVSTDGVPLLKDLPLVQYLFSRGESANFTRSLLVMLTPRRPVAGDKVPSSNEIAAGASTDPQVTRLRNKARNELVPPLPNLDTILLDLGDNELARQFQAADLRVEDWQRPPFLERTLRQIVDFLYF